MEKINSHNKVTTVQIALLIILIPVFIFSIVALLNKFNRSSENYGYGYDASGDVSSPELQNNAPSTKYSSEIDYSSTIRDFIDAEDTRYFPNVSDYFALRVEVYYNYRDVDRYELASLYETSWNRTTASFNTILDIDRIDTFTYDVSTKYSFIKNNEVDYTIIYSTLRFILDDNRKIIRLYKMH